MIRTESTKGESVKKIRERELAEKEQQLKALCNAFAAEKFGEDQLKKWSSENKGLWYLPILDENDAIEKLAIMRPINRNILSYASTKVDTEGLYAFLEVAMRECMIAGDMEIIDDDEYFVPAAMKFNKILEGKKAALVKR